MNRKMALASLILLGALSACGKVGPLEPTPNIAPPAKALGQEEASDSADLIKPSVQARPGRSDELLRRSERRSDDPFDLPPGSDAPKEQDSSASKPKPR